MDESSPLAMQFKELDDDNDNKLNVDQVYELLKVLGKNIYKGSVTSVIYITNIGRKNAKHGGRVIVEQNILHI
jgi:Ca2+-binding EF-hand superfamily protein